MESYFSQSDEDKMQDVRPEVYYQVGATPSYIEKPRILSESPSSDLRASAVRSEAVIPTSADPKWRFFWRIGERDSESSKFKELNAEPVVPQAFATTWADILNDWGGRMLGVATLLCTLLEDGLGLENEALSKLMSYGPHLLAPTGSYLGPGGEGGSTLAKVGTVLAGYHADLNFLTIHGRSCFPGLNIFTRSGSKVEVIVPPGCLFVQAGKQLEWLTGGHVLAGFHEVVVSEGTMRAVEEAKEKERALWRVSSTAFTHINSNRILQPLGRFSTPSSLKAYPPILCGDQVQAELQAINLKVVTKPLEAQLEGDTLNASRDQVVV